MIWICGFIFACTRYVQEPTDKNIEPELQKKNTSVMEQPKEKTIIKDLRIFVLQDGTQIKGTLIGTNNEGFKVHSKSMGTVHIPTKELKKMVPYTDIQSTSSSLSKYAPTRNISSAPTTKERSSDTPTNPMNPGLIKSIQDTMMNDSEIMGVLYTMQQDPQLMNALQDPQLLNLIQKGDIQSLQKHPTIQKLGSNPHLREILERMR